MTRSFAGLAVLAIVGILVLKVLVAIIGVTMSLVGTLIGLGVLALVIYLILRIVAPGAASRMREAVGEPESGNES